MRLFFDLSALHGNNFDAVCGAPLHRVLQRGQLQVFITPVFLEELLRGFGVQRRETGWQEKLQFCMGCSNGGIFRDRVEIWRDELIRGLGRLARSVRSDWDRRRSNLETRLEEVARIGDLTVEWEESNAARVESDRKRDAARAMAAELRARVAHQIRSHRRHGSIQDARFTDFVQRELVRTGRLLMDQVDVRRHAALSDQWARDPDWYPFYTSFVQGFLYAGFYAMVRHQDPIDRNAQADYEQLCYLNYADLVVSNDERFFRAAFEELWAPRGKGLMSGEEFVRFVEILA